MLTTSYCILHSIQECLCIHTPPSEVHTQPTLFPAEQTTSSRLQLVPLVPVCTNRLWFPSSELILTLTDRILTLNFSSIFSFPRHLLLEKVSQATKKKKKTCGSRCVCALLYNRTVLHVGLVKSQVRTTHVLRTPYSVAIKWFISTWW